MTTQTRHRKTPATPQLLRHIAIHIHTARFRHQLTPSRKNNRSNNQKNSAPKQRSHQSHAANTPSTKAIATPLLASTAPDPSTWNSTIPATPYSR